MSGLPSSADPLGAHKAWRGISSGTQFRVISLGTSHWEETCGVPPAVGAALLGEGGDRCDRLVLGEVFAGAPSEPGDGSMDDGAHRAGVAAWMLALSVAPLAA